MSKKHQFILDSFVNDLCIAVSFYLVSSFFSIFGSFQALGSLYTLLTKVVGFRVFLPPTDIVLQHLLTNLDCIVISLYFSQRFCGREAVAGEVRNNTSTAPN